MEQYCGFNIPEKIIIVSKPVKKYCRDACGWEETGEQQGYVVASDGKSSLEGALNWAGVEWHYVNNKQVYKDYDKYVHEYENGHFGLRIVDSADQSSQGGKLSFWTCEITAPDKAKYLIGINSDLLCDFILNNTLVKGELKDKVYLGKQKTRTGIFTENMNSFKQSRQDESIRNQKTSTKYEPGQKVFSKTDYKVYLGELYNRCEIVSVRESGWNHYYALVIYNTPKKVHAYGTFETHYDKDGRHVNLNNVSGVIIHSKKKSYCFNENDNIKVTTPYKDFTKYIDAELKEDLVRNNRFKDDLDTYEKYNNQYLAEASFKKLCYSDSNEKLEITDEVKNIFENYIKKYISTIYYCVKIPEYKIISEEEKDRLVKEHCIDML